MKQRQRAIEFERKLLRQLAAQFGMGFGLGAAFALWLLWRNIQHIFDVIAGSDAPVTLMVIFVVGLAAHFAFGAVITAFLMILSDDA